MVYIILGKGFEETEAIAPGDLLRRAGVPVAYAGIGGKEIIGSHGIPIVADVKLDEVDLSQLDMLVLPGGLGGVKSILASADALALTKQAWNAGKKVAAICAAPTILAKLGITEGHSAVCYPGMEDQMGNAQIVDANAVIDGNLITGRAAGAALDFGLALVEAMKDKETAQRVAQGIVYSDTSIWRSSNE